MKVLLVGHACSPDLGSEPGLTWNWAWHLSATRRVHVLTHPQYRASVERYLAEHENPNLHFEWVTLRKLWDPWDPAKGNHGLRLHYLLWQHAVYQAAARLHKQHRFDIVHHVSWGSVSVPPKLWRIPAPFVWGPIGGGASAPPNFRHYLGPTSREDALRSLRLQLLPVLPILRQTVRRTTLLLATNRETVAILKGAGARDVKPAFDNALPQNFIPEVWPEREQRAEVTMLWASRLEPFKGLRLGLEAMAAAGPDLPLRLVVAGGGSQRGELERLARELGLASRVTFLGYVPWREMPSLLRSADFFLFTSLRDSMGSVVLEAMAQGLPILTLNHQGVATLVPSDAGIKAPVTEPGETIAALARGMHELTASPELRRRMGRVSWEYAQQQTWEHRAAEMGGWYEECIAAHAVARSGGNADGLS